MMHLRVIEADPCGSGAGMAAGGSKAGRSTAESGNDEACAPDLVWPGGRPQGAKPVRSPEEELCAQGLRGKSRKKLVSRRSVGRMSSGEPAADRRPITPGSPDRECRTTNDHRPDRHS